MTQTITAYFDTRTEAQAAIDKLAYIDITSAHIKVSDDATGTETVAGEEKGFFASIADFFTGQSEEDRHTYAEGVRRGGTVVTVDAPEGRFEEIADILEGEGAADIDERAATWRSEGWEGSTASSSLPYTGGAIDSLGDTSTTRGSDYAAASGATGYVDEQDRSSDAETSGLREQYGRRDDSHGRTRIRSYVVDEQPSDYDSTDIDLDDERAAAERIEAERLRRGA